MDASVFDGQLRISPSCPYHATIAHMRYSVPYELVDVKVTESRVETMRDASKVTLYPRLRGYEGQYFTDTSHIVHLSRRSLPKNRVARWAQCGWIEGCETMVVISKTGCGKSYLAQALGNAAYRRLIPVRYTRLAWICDELNRARELGDGSCYEALDGLKGCSASSSTIS